MDWSPMDGVVSEAGALVRRTFKKEVFCDSGKLLEAFQTNLFCDVVLIGDGKR